MGHHEEPQKLPNHLAMSEHDYKHHKSEVYKTTIILSIVTIVEVLVAIFYEKQLIPMGWPISILRIFLIVASLVKAVYIMAVFMHVKHEKKMLVVTITIPFTLLIWMIISFMYDGNSWNLMNKDKYGSVPHPAVIEDNKGVSLHH